MTPSSTDSKDLCNQEQKNERLGDDNLPDQDNGSSGNHKVTNQDTEQSGHSGIMDRDSQLSRSGIAADQGTGQTDSERVEWVEVSEE